MVYFVNENGDRVGPQNTPETVENFAQEHILPGVPTPRKRHCPQWLMVLVGLVALILIVWLIRSLWSRRSHSHGPVNYSPHLGHSGMGSEVGSSAEFGFSFY